MLETIKQNPLPAALIGVGAGWLLISARQNDGGPARYEGTYNTWPRTEGGYRESSWEAGSASTSGGRPIDEQARETVDAVKEQAQQAAGRFKETTSDLSEQAREKANTARQGFQEQVRENPLGVGLAALALGVAVGFALPETRQENRWMGDARDTVMERAGQTAQEVAEKVQTVAKEAVSSATETAQQAANEQGLGA